MINQIQKPLRNPIPRWAWRMLTGILFAGGILLAGSDGAWWPLPNMAGLLIVGIIGIIATLTE